jgi:tRNA-splicing ligase RtcB (3'-phosphate/5'-hydroxy nucleic acid ligase)
LVLSKRARAPIQVFGEHEQKVVDQLVRCVEPEDGAQGVLCADGHYGYSQPVGGAVAYRDHISPAGVGYDIGCGNKAVLTDLRFDQVAGDLAGLMDEVFARVSFGVGRANDDPVDHAVLDEIAQAPVDFQRDMLDLAAKQLGTVGGGNHYVDLFRDEQDRVWIGVHFGSRGFGHRTAARYFGDGPMDQPPDLLRADSAGGEEYIAAMELAGRYAHAGRDVVVDRVLEILGAAALEEIHSHHNYAWRERHDGEDWWVVRKGCTPAFPGQRGFVGATMAGTSVILEGVESERSRDAFYSTVHGAGRAMSRTEAAGKQRKRWACANRDCDWVQPPRTAKPGRCPACGDVKLAKRWVREREGRIDWAAVERDVTARGIELRGANAEEAPGAYKDLRDVLTHHAGTVRVLHELHPIGVAMAPGDVFDPYKD